VAGKGLRSSLWCASFKPYLERNLETILARALIAGDIMAPTTARARPDLTLLFQRTKELRLVS